MKVPDIVYAKSGETVRYDDLVSEFYEGSVKPSNLDGMTLTEQTNLVIAHLQDEASFYDIQVNGIKAGKNPGDTHTIELYQMGSERKMTFHINADTARFVANMLCGPRSIRWFFWADKQNIIFTALAVTIT